MPEWAALRDFRLKRPIGYMSWRFKRRRLHDPAVAALIASDIRAAQPDHIALTGDVVNISAHDEFPAAANWMAKLGGPADMSFVPGNHDCYVSTPWARGLAYFSPWMTGDMRIKETVTTLENAAPFPFVRLRKNIAVIGLCSGLPQSLHRAAGRLGKIQINSLAFLLRDLRERGFARVVLIHHPPLPGQAPPRKALEDATALTEVLRREGAELVLHGHNHRPMRTMLETRFGGCEVIGVPSASMSVGGDHDPAGWNLYRIARQEGRWRIEMSARRYDPASGQIVNAPQLALSS